MAYGLNASSCNPLINQHLHGTEMFQLNDTAHCVD